MKEVWVELISVQSPCVSALPGVVAKRHMVECVCAISDRANIRSPRCGQVIGNVVRIMILASFCAHLLLRQNCGIRTVSRALDRRSNRRTSPRTVVVHILEILSLFLDYIGRGH